MKRIIVLLGALLLVGSVNAQLQIAAINAALNNCVTGQVSWTLAGGTPPLTSTVYELPSNTLVNTALGNSFTGNVGTSYVIVAADAMGSTSTSIVTITGSYSFGAQANRDTICVGDTVGLGATVNGLSASGAIFPSGYATSGASSAADEEILEFHFAGNSSISGCGLTGSPVALNGLPASSSQMYSNYTANNFATVAPGASVPFSVKVGQCGSVGFSGITAIYIDYNRDGIISATELAYSSAISIIPPTGVTYSGNITIPNNAAGGKTLMRVIVIENTVANPNGPYTWGETEDYQITIGYQLTGTTTWYPAAAFPNGNVGTNVVAAPTTSTVFTVVTTDTNVCNDTAYVSVHVKDNLNFATAQSVKTNTDCPLGTTGSIAVVTTPINAAVQYAWSNGNSGAIASNLGTGNYAVTITDSLGGCLVLHDTITSLGNNCGNLIGIVQSDTNNNCNNDAAEPGIANTLITVQPGNHITYTNAAGQYTFTGLPYNTYTITTTSAYGFTNVCTNTKVNTISSANISIAEDFVDSNIGIYNFYAHTWGWCLAPALGNNHRIIHYGVMPTAINAYATVFAIFDSIQHYGSSIPTHTSINGDTVFWNIANVGGTGNQIDITWNLDSTLPMGLSIPFKVGIKNMQFADTIMYNNFHTYNFTTCTSYDPNEKYVSPQGKTTAGYIPTTTPELTYTVKFQNTGNAAAANVVVKDVIPNTLDLTTIQVLHASHNYMVYIDGQTLRFKFAGIMLPDSNSDPVGSNGHITFSIKPKSNLVAGTTIQNTAQIFFDYNPAIVTGTTLNTLYKPLSAVAGNMIAQNSKCTAGACGNGSIQAATTDGVAPFVYTYSPICATGQVNTNMINGLGTGIFTITAHDAVGDEVSTTVNVTHAPSSLTLNTVSVVQPSNGINGSITVAATGGMAPYTYSWLPSGAATSMLTNLLPGTYTCSVTDAFDCKATVVHVINVASSIGNTSAQPRTIIYPSPASTTLHIESEKTFSTIRLLDATGKLVQRIECPSGNEASINVSAIAPGSYWIVLSNGAKKSIVIAR